MVVVPALLSPLIGLWTLLWAPVALAVAVLPAPHPRRFTGTAPAGFPGPEAADGDDRTADPPDRLRNGRRIRPIALPSAVDDYDLHFSAVVHWRWSSTVDLRLRDPMGPAVLDIVTRAAELARETDPADEGMAECELAARLAVEHAVLGSGIVVWADDVELRLAQDDTDRLRRTADLRKDRVVREVARAAEDDLAPLPPARPADRPLPAPAGLGAPEDTARPKETARPQGIGIDLLDGPGPGSDVDGEGYESYWWPAEEEDGHGGTERDVQVAILRGMIDSLTPGPERDAFVREQVAVLERNGFGEVADRLRAGHPDPSDPDRPDPGGD